MRVVVIGGTGHIGTYLVPRLVAAGHDVISVSRQQHQVYHHSPAWESVTQLQLDRDQAELDGSFGMQINNLQADAVIDLICFTSASARQLAEALCEDVQHFLHCGSIWVHGHSTVVPLTEELARNPVGEYGINKAAIETYLLDKSKNEDFPATILHPGHIVGPGWVPLNPAGNFNPEIFTRLAKGEQVTLPNLGMETLHHVHADDVALAFVKALEYPEMAIGESFHVVSPAALSLRGYAEALASWFGKPANLQFSPLPQWQASVSPTDATASWEHLSRSHNCCGDKARALLDFHPQYSSLEAIEEALSWLADNDQI